MNNPRTILLMVILNTTWKYDFIIQVFSRTRQAVCSNRTSSWWRVTGPLCGEFTGHRWIPLTKASDVELCCFLWSALNKLLSKQSWGWWFETPSRSLWRYCNVDVLWLVGAGDMLSAADLCMCGFETPTNSAWLHSSLKLPKYRIEFTTGCARSEPMPRTIVMNFISCWRKAE